MSPYEQLASIRRPLRFEGRPLAPRGRWVCFQATLNFWEHAQDVHAQNISSSMHISCPRNDTEAKNTQRIGARYQLNNQMGEGKEYLGLFSLVLGNNGTFGRRGGYASSLGRMPYFTWPSFRKRKRYTTIITDKAV